MSPSVEQQVQARQSIYDGQARRGQAVLRAIRTAASLFVRYSPILMVLVAFGLRFVVVMLRHTYQFPAVDHHFAFGYEPGSIARSVAEGEGFCSPFTGSTGPTAWIAPIPVYIGAAVFKVFGVFTQTSALVILALDSAFSSLTAAVIYAIGVRTDNKYAGLLGGWLWAIAATPRFAVLWTGWILETTLSALVTTVALLFAIELGRRATWTRWVGFGLLWGFASLVNPALLSILVVSCGWIALQCRRKRYPCAKGILIAALACVATMTPWLVRNRIVFGEWVFIRSNFGLELYLDNHEIPKDEGWFFAKHPTVSRIEYNEYKKMGEIAYVRIHTRIAVDYIRQHPAFILKKTGRHIVEVWNMGVFYYLIDLEAPPADLRENALPIFLCLSGLAIGWSKKMHAGLLLAGTLFIFPLPYYITFPGYRYRHPIEPVIVFMAAYFLVEASRVFYRRATPAVTGRLETLSRGA